MAPLIAARLGARVNFELNKVSQCHGFPRRTSSLEGGFSVLEWWLFGMESPAWRVPNVRRQRPGVLAGPETRSAGAVPRVPRVVFSLESGQRNPEGRLLLLEILCCCIP